MSVTIIIVPNGEKQKKITISNGSEKIAVWFLSKNQSVACLPFGIIITSSNYATVLLRFLTVDSLAVSASPWHRLSPFPGTVSTSSNAELPRIVGAFQLENSQRIVDVTISLLFIKPRSNQSLWPKKLTLSRASFKCFLMNYPKPASKKRCGKHCCYTCWVTTCIKRIKWN